MIESEDKPLSVLPNGSKAGNVYEAYEIGKEQAIKVLSKAIKNHVLNLKEKVKLKSQEASLLNAQSEAMQQQANVIDNLLEILIEKLSENNNIWDK